MKLTFKAWKAQVEAEMEKLAHLRCGDNANWGYRAAWLSGTAPKQAARAAVLGVVEAILATAKKPGCRQKEGWR